MRKRARERAAADKGAEEGSELRERAAASGRQAATQKRPRQLLPRLHSTSAADRKFREPLSERTRVMARNVLYPLYQAGNPQLRIFRTNFFIQLVRPGTVQPEDTVQFRIPMEMTRVDLKNYLQSIYNVPVAAVRTRVQHGSNKKRDHRNVRIKKPDYKVAYVQLAYGQTFTFPDLFPEKETSPDTVTFEGIQNEFMEKERERQKGDPRRQGVPDWFGL